MNGYSRLLRRKVGVGVLALACVAAAGWLRSSLTKDHITRDYGDGYIIQATAFDGHFGLVVREGFQPSGRTEIRWLHSQVESINEWAAERGRWISYWLGFGLVHLKLTNGTDGYLKAWFTHYACVAIPLTLLSTWLLLSKPRSKPVATQSSVDSTPDQNTPDAI